MRPRRRSFTMPLEREERTYMHRHKRRQIGRVNMVGGRAERVTIRLLGGFEVRVDGTATPERGWSRRSAAALVKVLALAPGQRLHREQVIDILWPDHSLAEAAPKLHKAAHYARKAAGCNDAVVLRNDVVQLFPATELTVDVGVFDALSRRALADKDPTTARLAIDHYPGELLPNDRYDEWAAERRELLRLRHLHLLRLAGHWLELSERDPADEGTVAAARCDPPTASIEGLVAQLSELARRQATLLRALADFEPLLEGC